MKLNKKDEIIILSENLRQIDIYTDFWIIAKECRESFYYLKSLKNLLINSSFLKADDVIKYKALRKNISDLIKEFEELDGDLINKSKNKFLVDQEIATELVSNNRIKDLSDLKFLKEIEILQYVKNFLDLNSKIGLCQVKILEFLIEVKDKMNKAIVSSDDKLKFPYEEYNLKKLMILAFNHSSDEDMIITNEIVCSDKSIEKALLQLGIEFPINVKTHDNKYTIEKNREIIKMHYELSLKLMDMSEKLNEENQINKLTKNQYSYSKQVTFLTWIVAILTVITTIVGGISLYYTIKSYNNTYNSAEFEQTIVHKNKD